jgi:hypothetical protein
VVVGGVAVLLLGAASAHKETPAVKITRNLINPVVVFISQSLFDDDNKPTLRVIPNEARDLLLALPY